MSSSAALALLLRLTSILAAGALAGCSPARPPPRATAAALSRRIVGKVALVDEVKRFVLIDLESNLYVPSPGTPLRTRDASGENARLKASLEQKRPFIAADILDGEPAVGDQVVQ